MSKIINWKDKIDENELNEVSEVLKKDGVIIFPTETVYGIGGNATSIEVIKKIYEIKKRPENKPLTILLKSKKEIEKYAIIQSDIERKIINKLMPGPITLILKKKNGCLSDEITSGKDTIGIRMPDNEIIQKLLNKCDFPIAAPSANISGRPSNTEVQGVLEDFDGKVDLIIDGGKCKESIASTIVYVENEKIDILREGTISKEYISKIVSE